VQSSTTVHLGLKQKSFQNNSYHQSMTSKTPQQLASQGGIATMGSSLAIGRGSQLQTNGNLFQRNGAASLGKPYP